MMTENDYTIIKEAVSTLRYFNFSNCNTEIKWCKKGGTKYSEYKYHPQKEPPINPYLTLGTAEKYVLTFLEKELKEYEEHIRLQNNV